MKWLIRCILIIISSLIFFLLKIQISETVLSALYTVSGVLFPIALSQIMSFSFSNIYSKTVVTKYRKQLSNLRKTFIVLFSIETFLFVITIGIQNVDSKINTAKEISSKSKSINTLIINSFDIKYIAISFIIFCIVYFSLNFIQLAKLKDEIEDFIIDTSTVNQ